MIMIVKTPGSQMVSPAAAEEGGEEMGGGRWESGERSGVQARSTLTSTAPKARSRSREVATLDELPRNIAESVIEIAVIAIVVDVDGHHSARTYIGMPFHDGGIRANIGILVDTVKVRGGTASRGTRRGAVIRCLTLCSQVVTTARRRRGISRVKRTVNDA